MIHAEAVRRAGDRDDVLHKPHQAEQVLPQQVRTGSDFRANAGQKQPGPIYESTESSWSAALGQIFTMMVAGLMGAGIALRDSDILVPEEGWGYGLGVAGGVSMLLLLLYPMVKRIAMFGFHKHSVFWLRAHMVLGTAGPLLIFFHSNFSLGATNSNVALFSMIVVALSGFAGRYIYTRVHRGLTSVRLDLNALLAGSSRLMQVIGDDTGNASATVTKAMADFASKTMKPRRGVVVNLGAALIMPFRMAFARNRIMADIRAAIRHGARDKHWSRSESRRRLVLARQHVNEFLGQAVRASQLGFWERMFSMWHVFHVPLFFVLFVSGVVHVVAVHLY